VSYRVAKVIPHGWFYSRPARSFRSAEAAARHKAELQRENPLANLAVVKRTTITEEQEVG
jgi:hypothetical protein